MATKKSAKTSASGDSAASASIEARIDEFADWRGETLRTIRQIIKSADPDVVEEWKWAKSTSPGVPAMLPLASIVPLTARAGPEVAGVKLKLPNASTATPRLRYAAAPI